MNKRQRFEKLLASISHYQTVVTKPWLSPARLTKASILVAAIAIILAAGANSWVRANQLALWQADRETNFIDGAPSFSTADAPFFLRYAMLMDSGLSMAEMDKNRVFPNKIGEADNEEHATSIFEFPMISKVLSVSSSNEIKAKLRNANLMIIITAAATALMITVCFGAAGYWTEGAVAAIGGGLSAAYLVRSSIGRIDTDQLNLGFMYLMFGLVVFAARAKSAIWLFAWTLAAAVSANIFFWWYHKAELIISAMIAFGWLLIYERRGFITTVLALGLFAIVSRVGLVDPLQSTYLMDRITQGGFSYINSFTTISEVQKLSITQILVSATGSVEMGIVCISGLAVFLVRHPVIAIAYGPLVAFGLLNFVIGNRAVFYSAPIMWFGAAFLITTTARFFAFNLSENCYRLRRDQSATVLATFLAMIIAWVNSPTDYLPRPSFSRPVLEGFASLKATADPTNSVVATWWDYGYASMLFNELPTFHDGGSQTTPSTHFIARAFLNPDQSFTIGNLKFLSTRGHAGIAAESSLAGLQQKFQEAISAPSPDLYLVVTSQMAGWMGAISQIGNWDIERGEPVDLRGNPNGPLVNYERLNCRLGGYPQKLLCTGAAFDLEHGLVDGAPVLAGWVHSQDGTTVRGKNFDHDGDLFVQIVQTGNRISVFLMQQQLFESSFNELFYLGQIDHPSISLHYDNYPHIRIYKIDGEPEG